MKLKGKVAVVTGASRGIGRNMCLELAKEGCDIVAAARSEQEPNPRLPGTIYATAEEVQALGGRALPVRTDVTDEESIAAMVQRTLAEFGRVDILINNAGIMVPGSVAELPLRRWDLVWRVNVRGAIACCREVLPQMIERRDGVIINISSILAEASGANNIPYSLTKQALRKLSEGLAEEVRGYNIRVFALSPEGLVRTPGTMFHSFEESEEAGGHLEPPEVMGRAAAYLCTEEAAPLSGRHFYSAALLREYWPEALSQAG